MLAQLFAAVGKCSSAQTQRQISHRRIVLFLVFWKGEGEKGLGSLVIPDRSGDSEVGQQVLWAKKSQILFFYITI